MPCEHEANEREWAPMPNGVLKLHPYCERCGTFKNVSSDKGKSIGYFVASLSKLKRILEGKGYKVSKAQIRLIVKELSEIDGFEDLWWITFSKQKEVFVKVVQKYIRVSKDLIESVL